MFNESKIVVKVLEKKYIFLTLFFKVHLYQSVFKVAAYDKSVDEFYTNICTIYTITA